MNVEIEDGGVNNEEYEKENIENFQAQYEIVARMHNETIRFQNELKIVIAELIDRKEKDEVLRSNYLTVSNLTGTRFAGDIKRAAMDLERKLLKFRKEFSV